MSDMESRARAWVEQVEDAYTEGGYAAVDGPSAPLEEMRWLLAVNDLAADVAEQVRRNLVEHPEPWFMDTLDKLDAMLGEDERPWNRNVVARLQEPITTADQENADA